MAEVTIREVEGDEVLDHAGPLTDYAFGPTPRQFDREERRRTLAPPSDRAVLVLFEDGRPLATAASWAMTQNVRGRILPMGGVAAVATDPLGRRRGYAHRVLVRLLEGMRERGQSVSALYPFRQSFYGRLGWAAFPSRRTMQLGPASLAPLLRREIPGQVRRRPLAEALDDYAAYLRAIQPATHGLALFPGDLPPWLRRNPTAWLLTAELDGETVGLMTYRLAGEDHLDLRADDFFHRGATGRYLLLQWLAQHVDHVRHAWLPVAADEQAETWLDDHDMIPHTAYSQHRYYDPMGRIVMLDRLDGPAVGEGALVVRVRDEQCPWNEGTWRLAGEGGRLTVERSTAEPACELTIQGLSALLFTGHDPADFPFRGWGDPAPAAQEALRRLFPQATPYLHAGF